jgi:hypothetical protein
MMEIRGHPIQKRFDPIPDPRSAGAFLVQSISVQFFRHSLDNGNPGGRNRNREDQRRHSRAGGNPVRCLRPEGPRIQRMRRDAPECTRWIPAFAGMTGGCGRMTEIRGHLVKRSHSVPDFRSPNPIPAYFG